jgi:hypothetical protein
MTKRGSPSEIMLRRYIRCVISGAAEPWVAPPAARQLSGVVTRILTKCHFALRPSAAIQEPRPTTPFRFESAVEGTNLFDNAQTPPTEPVE